MISIPETSPQWCPRGWRFGAHVQGNQFWLLRNSDGASLLAEIRPDLRLGSTAEAMRAALRGPNDVVTRADVTEQIGEALEVRQ